jgi:hypothetical protein
MVWRRVYITDEDRGWKDQPFEDSLIQYFNKDSNTRKKAKLRLREREREILTCTSTDDLRIRITQLIASKRKHKHHQRMRCDDHAPNSDCIAIQVTHDSSHSTTTATKGRGGYIWKR